MDSREQFEAWIVSEVYPGIGFSFMANGEYVNSLVQIRWIAWEAARASIVVELPAKEPDSGSDAQVDISAGFANRMREKCKKALRAAGITVKGDS